MTLIFRVCAVAAALVVPWYVLTNQPEWALAMVLIAGLNARNGWGR